MSDLRYHPKPGTWGAFKAAMEAAGVTDDDQIGYFDCRGRTMVIDRYELEDGEWRVTVE